ncbi:MAG: glycosyltransferase family 4 protein [Gemmatimonadales bacterium]
MGAGIRVLMITSDWPFPGPDATTHFIKRQAEFLQAAGIGVQVFFFAGRKNPLRYLFAWARVRRRIKGEHFDLIHAQFGQSGLLGIPKWLPLVVTFRGSDLLGIISDATGRRTLPGRVSQWTSRFVARQADAVIVVAEHMKRFLPPGVAATVLPSGLDLALFRPVPLAEARRRLGLPEDRYLVVFAGRPSQARKRFDLAKRAVDVLRRSLPADLHVVWGVPHEEVPLHMSAGDVLLFTSRQEGSPNVVKEALACNLPVVSVRVADVPERLQGVAGCEVCDDERPEALAAALERILLLRERSNGREAVQSLDESLLTARLIVQYRSVLQSRESRQGLQH